MAGWLSRRAGGRARIEPNMPSSYHLEELQIVRTAGDPRRSVPAYPCRCWKVLDVGCGIGQTLTAAEFSQAAELHGIEPDAAAVSLAQSQQEPRLRIIQAKAEALPYLDNTFDLVFARVSLPYTNIPRSLDEMRRVLKPRGYLWLTMHPLRMEIDNMLRSLLHFSMKSMIDQIYVMTNSATFALTGRCVARPWNGTYESFQTAGGMRRALQRAGFQEIKIDRGRHFTVTARRSGESAQL